MHIRQHLIAGLLAANDRHSVDTVQCGGHRIKRGSFFLSISGGHAGRSDRAAPEGPQTSGFTNASCKKC
jgi:hypothetical protein